MTSTKGMGYMGWGYLKMYVLRATGDVDIFLFQEST